MQERVAIVAVEGQEPIPLDGVEPLDLTTQLNRIDVPAHLSLLGRHSTIPCCYAEILSPRGADATRLVTADGITLDDTANAITGSSSMFRTDLFKGKRFLVTGGGTGLGRIMMEKFVELGADCVICGRRGGVLEETARQVMAKNPGRRVDTHAVDIRVATAVEEMMEGIWAGGAAQRIGQQCCRKFHFPDQGSGPARFDAIANIVLHGTFYTTNACGKRWIAEQEQSERLSILTTWVWPAVPSWCPRPCPRRASP